jgi:alcohol dehydrogenase
MRALHYERWQGPVVVADLPDPAPPVDGVVVAVAASGLCRSDWHAWMGHDAAVRLPHVPGHEFAGTVVAVGADVRRWAVGDRVTTPFVMACGRCGPCRAGQRQVCLDQWQPGFDGWGSHAEFVAVPRADGNLVAVPDHVDLAVAAGLGCRVTTAHRAVVDRAAVTPGQWLAVHGCGGVGLSAVLVAVAVGARVVAVDIDADRLRQAQALGAEAVVDARHVDDVAAAVRDVTGGGARASVDAVGDAEVCRAAIAGLAVGGRHVQVGLLPTGAHLPMDLVVARELAVVGSHGMAADGVAAVLADVAAGRLDVARLPGERVSLAAGAALLTAAADWSTVGLTVIDRFAAP